MTDREKLIELLWDVTHWMKLPKEPREEAE